MSETRRSSHLAGTVANLITLVGLALFFFGIFGPVRTTLFPGIAVLLLGFVAYYVEEFGRSGL